MCLASESRSQRPCGVRSQGHAGQGLREVLRLCNVKRGSRLLQTADTILLWPSH